VKTPTIEELAAATLWGRELLSTVRSQSTIMARQAATIDRLEAELASLKPWLVVRHFERAGVKRRIIRTGLTFAEANALCMGVDASSATCTTKVGKRRTREIGPWRDECELEKASYRRKKR